MFRKAILGFLVTVACAMSIPTSASAGGGFHRHGFYRGFGGPGFGWGYPGYYGYGRYGYGFGYPSIYRYEDLGGCRLANQRIRTAKGWRVRRVEVCE
ncbi:hypothetical protein RPMA_18795 [Tardiphaga alba]|uniref:Sulfur globule protein n=1 Tax=Tardiphaga alba TaxID=340268 RepID=A0ABX8AEB4_9BRAD|nr:hypothetical protein [Tardiphaga alba]QUS40650.1 hypothetical protein RPMA_18795 [Tardiphaga alba]